MSSLDVLRSFAESWELDERTVPGLTYGDARELYRYLLCLEADRSEALRSKDLSEHWFAVRFRQLRKWAKEKGLLFEFLGVMANGTGSPFKPPNYAQRLNLLRHRVQEAERRYDELRMRLGDPYYAARKWDGIAIVRGHAVQVRW